MRAPCAMSDNDSFWFIPLYWSRIDKRVQINCFALFHSNSRQFPIYCLSSFIVKRKKKKQILSENF